MNEENNKATPGTEPDKSNKNKSSLMKGKKKINFAQEKESDNDHDDDDDSEAQFLKHWSLRFLQCDRGPKEEPITSQYDPTGNPIQCGSIFQLRTSL